MHIGSSEIFFVNRKISMCISRGKQNALKKNTGGAAGKDQKYCGRHRRLMGQI